MTKPSPVERDERTTAVENASYRWSYLFVSYGLLVLVAFRDFVKHEAAWDLLLLTVLGGVVGTVYQKKQQVLSRQWVMTVFLVIAIAVVLGALMAMLRRWHV